MRKTLTTAALVLAFSCPALAGEIATPGSPAPPPTTASVAQGPTADGIIHGDAPESLTQTVLDLLTALF
jgi:hypothetical protein